MAKNKKKRLGFGPMGWLVAILLLLGSGGVGVMTGLFGDGTTSNSTNDNQGVSSTQVESGEVETTTVNIKVSGDTISWNDEDIESNELSQRIEEADENTNFIITDDNAIKATYDNVIDSLNEAQAEYQESETQ